MSAVPAAGDHPAKSVAIRSVVIAGPDAGQRARLHESLAKMRWLVRQAGSGAEAIGLVEELCPEALVVDSWLPDLELGEFAGYLRTHHPALDVLRVDGQAESGTFRSPRRHELLHALREAAEGMDDASAPAVEPANVPVRKTEKAPGEKPLLDEPFVALPGMVGESRPMRELARMIRLVAPRTATVLIEGETGTGKEVVARALHRLSMRASKPYAVLNCAAIPETLLEAELFGHTRGAFTGAVQSRVGRIEAANGGTLFLDEIGEMPLALQAKMLRFLESGELQRVGDNETMRVDVRILAATHQRLEEKSNAGAFRLDLYHRLAVFPMDVPALRERMEDLPLLVEFFLEQMGREMPRKRLQAEAMRLLGEHDWPGNVRELMHVLARAEILAADSPAIGPEEIRIRRSVRR